MNEKFTPGPWYLEFDNCDEEGFLEEAEFTGAIVGADGEGILQVYSKANAHLISAAPDMYGAIKTHCHFCEEEECGECMFLEVLKKARGEL